ncbi:MAG: hypothetical protein ACK47B_13480 [Armatimonadota bacterium]
MTCTSRNEEQIISLVAGELHGLRRWRLARHLRACPACSEALRHYEALQADLRSLAELPPTPAFSQRVDAALSSLAASGTQSHPTLSAGRGRRLLLRSGVALAASVGAAVLMLLMQPNLAAAQAVQRIERAMSGARSAHITFWSVTADARREKEQEVWYQEASWRVEGGGGRRIEICREGKRYLYQPGLRRVTVSNAERPAAFASSSGFTLQAILRDQVRSGIGSRTRIVGEPVVEGRPARELILELSGESVARVRMLVDRTTDLPIRWEGQSLSGSTWITDRVGEATFNVALPSELFRPEFPPSTRYVDLAARRREWQQRVRTVRARGRIPDREFAVRDLQLNPDGDVFLLYTVSRSGDPERDWSVELRDDLGTPYLPPVPRWPYRAARDPSAPHEEDLGIPDLHASWWVIPQPQPRRAPRELILTFRAQPPLPADEGAPWQVTLRFPVARPAAAAAPDYLPLLALAPGGEEPEWTIREWAAATRAHHFRTEARDVEQALKWQRRVVELSVEQQRATGARLRELSREWLLLYQLCRDLGRRPEALAALRKAAELERAYPSRHREQIEQALDRETGE